MKSLGPVAYWCSGGESDTGAASGGKVSIGLVTKTNSNPYFVKLRESAQAEADAKGAKLIALAGKSDGDNQGQVDAINNLVTQGVKGILVIALDTATDPADAVDATFATDNKAAGVKQGKYVKATLGDKKPAVVLLDGTPGSTVDDLRHKGFLEGFGLTNGSSEIKGTAVTNGDQTKAQTAMEKPAPHHPSESPE